MTSLHPKTNTALDYAFIAPSILLLISFLCSLVPGVFCSLNKLMFAALSFGMLITSIGFHIYTLILWKRYWGLAPLAYALGQPALHFIIFVFGSIISATLTCENIAKAKQEEFRPFANERILYIDYLEHIFKNFDKVEPTSHSDGPLHIGPSHSGKRIQSK